MWCAENITCWWMLKHHEQPEEERHVSFPGEVAMPQGLMPAAIWLGTQEYSGVWRYGGGEGQFHKLEIFGALGDSQLTALYNTLLVYRTGAQDEPSWRLLWYCDNFTNWAIKMLHLPNLLSLARHNPEERENWCGVCWCLYPYVALVVEHHLHLLLLLNVVVIQKEDLAPCHHNWRVMCLRWGAYLHVEGLQVAGLEEEEEEEDMEEDNWVERDAKNDGE